MRFTDRSEAVDAQEGKAKEALKRSLEPKARRR
jgi:hypothetical protein